MKTLSFVSLRRIGVPAAIVLGLAGCSNSDNTNFTGSATTITPVVSAPFSGTVGTLAGAPFIFKVTDASGNPVQGVVVNFTIAGGGATLVNATATTDVQGVAFTSVQYGDITGAVTVTAAATGVTATASIPATQTASDPVSIVATNGNNQAGQHGGPLPDPFGVRVLDQFGNGVPLVSVAWASTNGTFSSASTSTNTTGAAANTLNLGSATGTLTVTASALIGGTTQAVHFTATSQ